MLNMAIDINIGIIVGKADMKILPQFVKLFIIIVLCVMILVIIWFILPDITFYTDFPFASIISRLFLTIIFILTSVCIYLWIYGDNEKKSRTIDRIKKTIFCANTWIKQLIIIVISNITLAMKVAFSKNERQLQKLPWLILIGAEKSGKTTLVYNSDIDILSIHKPSYIQKYISDKTFTWHYTNEVIILEATNDVLYAEKNKTQILKSNWNKSFSFAKLYSWCKKFDGLIVTINLPQLLENENNLNTLYLNLVQLLKEFVNNLNYSLPLYFIFTHCDQIVGFNEFFSDLSKKEREKYWGISIDSNLSTKEEKLEHFNDKFNELINALNKKLLMRLAAENSIDDRAVMSYFPQQINLFKSIIAKFLIQEKELIMKGVYLASGGQGGTVYDFLMKAMSAKFNLPTSEVKPYTNFEKTFFMNNLFKKIILPGIHDYNLTKKSNVKKIYLLNLIVLLLGLVGLSTSYALNKVNIEYIESMLPQYQQAIKHTSANEKDLQTIIPLLDIVKDITHTYQLSQFKWLLYFELYEPFRISSALEKFWQQTLVTELIPKITERLAAFLQTHHDRSEQLYQYLKGYMALSQLPYSERDWVKSAVSVDLMQSNYQIGNIEKIKLFINECLKGSFDKIFLDQQLVSKIRNILHKFSLAEILYYEIKLSEKNNIDSIKLADIFNEKFNRVFAYDKHIIMLPKLFTLNGYLKLKNNKLSTDKLPIIYKVLGIENQNDLSISTVISPNIWSIYNSDYIDHWHRFLNGVEIIPFDNFNQAIRALEILTDFKSPLKSLLLYTKLNTNLVHDKKLTIASYFSDLNSITSVATIRNSKYQIIVQHLENLKQYLININAAQNRLFASLQAVFSYLQDKDPKNPIKQLKLLAATMPTPLCSWLDSIANNSFKLLLPGAQEVINDTWKTNIIPVYHNEIINHYPFAENSTLNVNLASFVKFFGNNGLLKNYIQTYLLPFINTKTNPWQLKTVGKYLLNISNNTLMQLQNSAVIRAMFFSENDENISFNFFIQPHYLDAESSSVNLQIGNQNIVYRHGPQQMLTWHVPINDELKQINISINDFHEHTFSKNFDDSWGLLKLLSTSQLQAIDKWGRYLFTIHLDKHTASFYLKANNNMPIFDLNILRNFKLPDDLFQ